MELDIPLILTVLGACVATGLLFGLLVKLHPGFRWAILAVGAISLAAKFLA